MTATKPEVVGTAQGMRCTHCTLPVPAGLIAAGADRQFCCSACRTAYAIINEHGLDDYYAFAERRDRPVTASGRGYEEFDHDAFRAIYVQEGDDGLSECDLYLDGVHCASCVWLVEKVPLAIPGVVSAELDIGRSRCRVRWDRGRTPLSAIARFLDTLGYVAHPFRGARADERRRREDRASLVNIGIAGAIAGANLALILADMSRAWTAPVISRMRSDNVDLPWSMWAMIEKLRMLARSIGPFLSCSRANVGVTRAAGDQNSTVGSPTGSLLA